MPSRRAFFLCLTSIFAFLAQAAAQTTTEGVDTTSAGYRIGHAIGSYLPVAIILILAVLVIWRSYRLGRQRRDQN